MSDERLTYTSATGDIPGVGIFFTPTAGAANLHVTDSVIWNNGLSSSGGGIVIQPSGGASVRADIVRTQVKENTYGIFANGTGTTGFSGDGGPATSAGLSDPGSVTTDGAGNLVIALALRGQALHL